MNLSCLPLEILLHIAICVEAVHRPSIHTFSLTSKACHKASVSVVFRRISITIRDCEGLRFDGGRLIEALCRTDSFRHVQQITIRGVLSLDVQKIEGYRRQTPWMVTSGLNEVLHEEPILYQGMYAVYDEGVIQRSSAEDKAWSPIVNLLRATSQLKDIIYECQSQFPPSLLSILHEQHPQCRLHHLSFKFRTLLWGVPYTYEMELATSPSLYRVKAVCARRDSDSDDDFNLEAVMELAARLAPNLKKVTILNLSPAGSLRARRPRESWSGLPGYTGGNRGSLTSLSLKGFSRLHDPAMLQDWARHIDFACLQQLTLGGCHDASRSGLSGATMEWVARTLSFPRVKALSVYLHRDDVYNERPHYSEQAVSFLQNFNSLEQLSIHGPLDLSIVDAVLSHHGETLIKLSLHPIEENLTNSDGRDLRDIPFVFSKDHILKIKAQCPVLEELAIPIKRNASRSSEVELYRYLGGMKSLRSIFLVLDCSNWRVARDPKYKPEFSEEDQRIVEDSQYPFLMRGELKETFMNCAVDETLARSIWKVISQNKSGRRLERLKLWHTGGGEYGIRYGLPETFMAMARHLARSWLIERVPRDDQEDFTVRELGKGAREVLYQSDSGYLAARHDPELWKAFHSVWPPRETSKDWRDDWSSMPLPRPI